MARATCAARRDPGGVIDLANDQNQINATIALLRGLTVDQLGRSVNDPTIRDSITGPVMDASEIDPATGEPLAGTPATPPAGTDPSVTPPAGENGSTAPGVTITPEIQKLIDAAAAQASKDANREAVAAKRRARELEEAEQARKDAELSETERLQKERDAAVSSAAKATEAAHAALLRAEVTAHAATLKFVDTDAALALMARDGIEFSDDGTVTGVLEALTTLAAAKPGLIDNGPGTPALGANNPERQGTPEESVEQRRARHRGHDQIVGAGVFRVRPEFKR